MNTKRKALAYAAAVLLLSAVACGDESPNTRVVIDIDDSITRKSVPIIFMSLSVVLPRDLVEQTPDDPEMISDRYTFVSVSDEAGPTFGVVIRAYSLDTSTTSDTEAFWFDPSEHKSVVARVGLRTGFVTGETRFVTLRPTNGCLDSTESIPDREPRSLGREGRPLVLDGCSDEDDSTDTDETDAGL